MSSHTYSAFMPTVDDTKYDPLTPFTHTDPASRALARELEGVDPLAFLANAQVSHITPLFGDEISGVDLTSLDSNSRDQLALLAARRGVLVFRNQMSFLGKDAEWYKNWGSHFGR
jgi:sulfonate dioxygenase